MLKKGMKGDEVRQLQHDLTRVGYLTKIDGDFGLKTEANLRAFQKDNALLADGIFGPYSAAVMAQKIGGLDVNKWPTPVSPGATPWMDWLERNKGEREISGRVANPFIIDMFRYTSLADHPLATSDETAWCAACACAALEKNGFSSPNSARAASFDEYGEKTELRYGAIVTFKWSNGSRHVAFYSSTDSKGRLVCLGGNQGNALKESYFDKKYLVASRWPVKNSSIPS